MVDRIMKQVKHKRNSSKSIRNNNDKTKSVKNVKKQDNEDNWIATLVQKASASASSASKKKTKKESKKSNGTNYGGKDSSGGYQKNVIQEHEIVLSKQERIERRENKKRRRMEKQLQQQQQQQCLRKEQQLSNKRQKQMHDNQTNRQDADKINDKRSNRTLIKLSNQIREITNSKQRTKSKNTATTDYFQSLSRNTVRGKATSKQQLTDQNIQPRKGDYNGLGLARPSLLILLRDESFIPKFEEEFREHVHGFFGKQRTKAMKKQLDGNMLWRRLLKEKEGGRGGGSGKKSGGGNYDTKNVKWNGTTLTDMKPDERIEAMIQLGMI